MISLTLDDPSDGDQRIDKFLKKYLKDAPLGGIYKWIRTGKIKVNKKKVDQNYRLESLDVIDIYLTPDEIAIFQKSSPSTISRSLETDEGKKEITPPQIDIIYEDDGMLIVNKPPGMNVHPGDHKTKEISLIELIQDALHGRYDTLSFRPALVHRIDRDTSGAVMIAKNKKTLDSLLSLLQTGKIEKTYHAIVISTPPKPRDTIRTPLLRIENAKNESKVRIDPHGQEAITHYHTLTSLIKGKYSLLEVRIETGRMHQIRVHLSSIGCPVLGDRAYGASGENSFARRSYGVMRQLLHARNLSFIHPFTGKPLSVRAEYPPDMQAFLDERHLQ